MQVERPVQFDIFYGQVWDSVHPEMVDLKRLPRRACKVKISGRTRAPEDFRIKLVRFGRYLVKE